MFTYVDGGANPGLVFIGIVIAQLFLYGRKVKSNTRIRMRHLVGDIMQFGVVFITCMGFVRIADGMLGFNINDEWQLITVVIVFNMSFDALFTKLREGFNRRLGAAVDILVGNTPTPGEDVDEERVQREVGAPLHHSYDGIAYEELPADQKKLLDDMP